MEFSKTGGAILAHSFVYSNQIMTDSRIGVCGKSPKVSQTSEMCGVDGVQIYLAGRF